MEQNDQNNKKPMNLLVIAGLVYVLVVIVLISAIVLVKMNRNTNGGNTSDNSTSVTTTEPTSELAQSVCEKNGGSFISRDVKENTGYEGLLGVYACTGPSFEYEVYFVGEENVETYKSRIESIIDSYTVLEKSNDFTKVYYGDYGYYNYVVIYKNVMAYIMTKDASFGDNLSVELGFPDRGRIGQDADEGVDEDTDYEELTIALTPEIVESVCEKYDGKIVNFGENGFVSSLISNVEGISNVKICERYTRREVDPDAYRNAYNIDGSLLTDQQIQDYYGVSIGPKDFSYEVGFLGDDQKENYRNELRNSILNYEGYEDVSKYTVLEDSEDVFKACNTVAGLVLMCTGVHDNVVLMINSYGDLSTVDKLFANLGFPDRNRLGD